MKNDENNVFYVISNNYINTGSILTAVNGGLVDVFISDDKDININVPTFKALSSGTTVPVRLIYKSDNRRYASQA